MPLCRGAVFEMEHQGLVREGIDALDSFQKDALIKLGKAEHLEGRSVCTTVGQFQKCRFPPVHLL